MAKRTCPKPESDDAGFTLAEVVVAMGILAFLFAAIAGTMLSLMNVLSVQKSRTQGNDIATVAIEDLQRLSYANLGLCSAPTGTPPSGLSDTVLLPNCGSATRYQVCEATVPPATAVPDEEYSCVRRGLTYGVKRFVAYGDVAHTVKRLAVHVEWRDTAGHHQVSQQSSLRIPSQSAAVGNPPPAFVSAGTTASPINVPLRADASNDVPITFNAQTTGLTTADTVVAVVSTVSAGAREQKTVPLTTTDGTSWSGSLPAGGVHANGTTFAFGHGTQFVTFTATRTNDGKVNSMVYGTAMQLAAPTPPAFAASMTVTQQPPATIALNASGELLSPFTLRVSTQWITPEDSVLVTFETRDGAVSLALQNTGYLGGACTDVQCQGTWEAAITPGQGHHFKVSPPTGRYYFSAGQIGNGPTNLFPTIDSGTTTAVASSAVTYQ